MGGESLEILAIIPARGGSKGLPRKNVLPLRGKPLVAHSIEQAKHSKRVTRTVVSTDDLEIANISRRFGAEVIDRPTAIAGDAASSESALAHALEELRSREGYEPDLVVFLQATSPLRRATDIDDAIRTMLDAGADSLLSVCTSHDFLWTSTHAGARSLNYEPQRRPRRQDMEPQFRENGSIYIFRPRILHESGSRLGGRVALHEMDSLHSFQIDTREDFELIEMAAELIERRRTSTSGRTRLAKVG